MHIDNIEKASKISKKEEFHIKKESGGRSLISARSNMHPVLNRCPVCQAELIVTRLHCSSCDTVLDGRFATSHFANLSTEQIEFVITFIRCEGKINRMEPELKLSYPTIRNRLQEVIRALGFEPGHEEASEIAEDRRNSILDDLDAGKISADDAMRRLRGEEEGS